MQKPQKSAPSRRTSPPRPDQLSDETFEFLTAVDLHKRKLMLSHLAFEQVFPVLEQLGYSFPGEREGLLKSFDEALDVLRQESDRLFPSWSEIFEVALELGWERQSR